jgi:hypothetical protein
MHKASHPRQRARTHARTQCGTHKCSCIHASNAGVHAQMMYANSHQRPRFEIHMSLMLYFDAAERTQYEL